MSIERQILICRFACRIGLTRLRTEKAIEFFEQREKCHECDGTLKLIEFRGSTFKIKNSDWIIPDCKPKSKSMPKYLLFKCLNAKCDANWTYNLENDTWQIAE